MELFGHTGYCRTLVEKVFEEAQEKYEALTLDTQVKDKSSYAVSSSNHIAQNIGCTKAEGQ